MFFNHKQVHGIRICEKKAKSGWSEMNISRQISVVHYGLRKYLKNVVFSRSGGSRGRAGERDREGSAGSTGSEHRADRELRWRDRHYSGPRKWLSNALLSVRVAQPHSGMLC